MPRRARSTPGGFCYHVLNRGNERQRVFHSDNECASFIQLMARARNHQAMRIVAYCLMPNHFHLCLWPFEDGDIGEYMKWLMSAHASQYRKSHPGAGHIWQGRYKAFAAQDDGHLLTVLRYIERNPVRAGLVERAENWPWSSVTPGFESSPGPVPRPANWIDSLHTADDETQLARLRASVNQGLAFGAEGWVLSHPELE